jgi:hypothetical protein
MNTSSDSDWAKAVAIFADRIDGRFLAQIKAIRENRDEAIREWSGFAILALDCLLIETLGQFYNGFDQTPDRKDKKRNPLGFSHKQFYAQFMSDINTFSKDFDTNPKRVLFYEHFRCGILHQAQTKMKSKVRFGEQSMVQFADANDPDQGLIIDRDKLHDALIAEIDAYKSLLIAGTDQVKRDHFITKMNFVAV